MDGRPLQEKQAYALCAYAAQRATIQARAHRAQDFTNKPVRKGSVTEKLERMGNRAKSRKRARVEHVSGAVKHQWEFGKVRYRGLVTNATRAFMALAIADVHLARKSLRWPIFSGSALRCLIADSAGGHWVAS